MKQLILDLDTGIDDALAILYALGLEQEGLCRLAGITCTFGNVTAGTAARNSRALLELLGRPDIPVYEGENRLFGTGQEYEPAPVCLVIHGENGIGNVDIPGLEENFVDCRRECGPVFGGYGRKIRRRAGCGGYRVHVQYCPVAEG